MSDSRVRRGKALKQSQVLRGGAGLALAVSTIALGGCAGGSYPGDPANTLPDGEYSGQSVAETDGSYGIVNFTVTGGKVTAADFLMFDQDGTPHDENYGLGSDGTPADEAFYQRAQNAILAEQGYVSQFVEAGDQDAVETIAGASLSYRAFRSAVSDAITNAGA
ncbi:MAG: FMN-binding protein [Scrofimicrobium sp.]